MALSTYARADSQLQPALHVIIAIVLAEYGPGCHPTILVQKKKGCGYEARGSRSAQTPVYDSTCFLHLLHLDCRVPVGHHGCRKLVGHLDSSWQPSSMHLPSVGHHGCLTMLRGIPASAESSAKARVPSVRTSQLGQALFPHRVFAG
jgi:hypothetical protein